MFDNTIQKIADYFEFARHAADFKTEILAGLSTFLALSYIFVVNPAILGQAGMDKSAVLFATIAASASMTLLMGLWAKKPFVLAPGMEMNAYVAFFVVGSLGFAWQQALGAVFWSGILCLLFTITNTRRKIINAIPDKMKTGLSLSVGVFLMLIALKLSNIFTYEGIRFSGIGQLASPQAITLYAGIAFILLLERFQVKGSVLISILACSALAIPLGIANTPAQPVELSQSMFSALFQLDLTVIINPKILSIILILFLLDFYGSIAKFIGLTRNTSIVDGDGSMPRMKEAMAVDGIGTVTGAVLGTTSIITYVESRIGITEGGRTGLTAITCGLLMAAFIFLTPLVNLIPLAATTGALLFVGIKLLPQLKELMQNTRAENTALLAMITATIATFAIDKAMLIGFTIYIAANLIERKPVNPYLAASTVLLAIGTVLTL